MDLFPNAILSIHAEEVTILRPHPHPTEPNKCFFDKILLQINAEVPTDPAGGLSLLKGQALSEKADRPEHQIFNRASEVNEDSSLSLTIDQEILYLPDMQAGLRSQGLEYAWLNEDESLVQHFHYWLDDWMANDSD
jgi:hypothetical protein